LAASALDRVPVIRLAVDERSRSTDRPNVPRPTGQRPDNALACNTSAMSEGYDTRKIPQAASRYPRRMDACRRWSIPSGRPHSDEVSAPGHRIGHQSTSTTLQMGVMRSASDLRPTGTQGARLRSAMLLPGPSSCSDGGLKGDFRPSKRELVVRRGDTRAGNYCGGVGSG
jgi:hypothetical protein